MATPQPQSSLFSQYQTKLAPLTEQSDKLLKEYYSLASQAPSFAQRLLDSIKQAGQYPNQAAMREEYSKNPNLTPMAVESLVSKRGQTTRGTIQDVMGRAQGGFESDVASRQGAAQMAQQQRSGLLEEYGLARQEQQDVLAQQQTGRGTVGERQLSRVRDSVIADVKGGLKTEDLARKYGGQMDDWELINLYNENSPYGTMTEAPQTFKDWTSKKDDENKVETAEKTAEYITQIDTYTSKEEALRDFEIYKSVMEAQGVDVEKIRQAIEDKFPETANDVSGGISKFLQELLKTRTYG